MIVYQTTEIYLYKGYSQQYACVRLTRLEMTALSKKDADKILKAFDRAVLVTKDSEGKATIKAKNPEQVKAFQKTPVAVEEKKGEAPQKIYEAEVQEMSEEEKEALEKIFEAVLAEKEAHDPFVLILDVQEEEGKRSIGQAKAAPNRQSQKVSYSFASKKASLREKQQISSIDPNSEQEAYILEERQRLRKQKKQELLEDVRRDSIRQKRIKRESYLGA